MSTHPTTPGHARRRRGGAIAGACVLALATSALAACSNGGGGTGAGGELTYEDSPLNAYFSVFNTMGDMTPQEQQAFYDEQTRKQEELIAQCMADQGFEFNPEGSAGYTIVGDESTEDGPAYGTVEYAEQYGYHAFTWFGEEQPTPGMDEGEEWVDPNADITAAMSESELQAWQEALYGAQDMEWDPEADVEDFEWNWEDMGCQGWAQHEAEQSNPQAQVWSLMDDPRFAELFEQMNSLYEQGLTDPKVAELNGEWSSCMADAGFTYSDPMAAQQHFYDLSNAVWEEHDGTDTWEPDPATMQKNKDEEIATAVADATCQKKLDFQNKSLRIQFDIEQKFVDENKAALDEFAAAAQELQK